jgi:hypothetical protein
VVRAALSSSVRINHLLSTFYLNGGEGGIRTPDRVTPMPDFESGALAAKIVFTYSCKHVSFRCYLECHTKSDRVFLLTGSIGYALPASFLEPGLLRHLLDST